jgi:hypothetical protein
LKSPQAIQNQTPEGLIEPTAIAQITQSLAALQQGQLAPKKLFEQLILGARSARKINCSNHFSNSL